MDLNSNFQLVTTLVVTTQIMRNGDRDARGEKIHHTELGRVVCCWGVGGRSDSSCEERYFSKAGGYKATEWETLK